jgi:hypothetical protein
LGLLALTLFFGSELCLAAIVLFWFEERKRTRQIQMEPPDPDLSDYVAVYPLSDRIVSVAVAAFFGIIGLWLALRSSRLTGLLICTGLGIAMTCCSVVYIWTRIHFTINGIEVRLPARGTFSETYGQIRAIRSVGRAGLSVEFSDGRTLRLYPGLGNADAVLRFLHKNCPERVWKTSQ